MMRGFTMSKSEFENIFLQTAESMDTPERNAQRANNAKSPSRFGRQKKTSTEKGGRGGRRGTQQQKPRGLLGEVDNNTTAENSSPRKMFRNPPEKLKEPELNSPEEAVDYADMCRKHAASLQRCLPADYDGAGEFFEKAVDARAKFGLFCTSENADAHVEYAQNLSKRGLTPEAEYHLRSAADIYRMLNARSARKYGDVLLYMAVVIDRQGRLAEAENFYRSALAVYRANKLSDDNVRVAIDSLSNNLRAQGRGDEVDAIVRRHFLGALD